MSDCLKLYSSWFCPFAQRAWIALLVKDLQFEYVEIDPYNKSPEFLAVNPRGLVPVIILPDGKTVYESSVCVEYSNEVNPDVAPLLPKDAWERAHVRMWCDYTSKRIVPLFYKILMCQNMTELPELKQNLLENLKTFSDAIDEEGPFFMGKNIGMADIMVFPHAMRIDTILKEYRDFEIPKTREYNKINRLVMACLNHPKIVPTLADKEKLIAKYKRYEDDSAKTEVADAVRKGGVMP